MIERAHRLTAQTPGNVAQILAISKNPHSKSVPQRNKIPLYTMIPFCLDGAHIIRDEVKSNDQGALIALSRTFNLFCPKASHAIVPAKATLISNLAGKGMTMKEMLMMAAKARNGSPKS
jgi:hypothetical protein